jgi:hypothetical protein
MRLIIGTSLLLVIAAPAAAQSQSNRTCSAWYQGCLKINTPYGEPHVKRCGGYREHCMRTGEWIAPKFRTKGLARQ